MQQLDVTVFTKNRCRLPDGNVARGFLAAVLADPKVKPLLSSEHFSVDGTLIEAWASMKSFVAKDGSGAPPAPGRNTVGNMRKTRHRGTAKRGWMFTFVAAAYNLVRIPKLLVQG